MQSGLTDDLEGVNKWMKDNKLKLNVKKTQLIVLSKKRRACELENVEVKLERQSLTRKDTVKYLGVWVDDKLTWQKHIEETRKKCFRNLAQLRKLRDILPEREKKKVYRALILPHVDYCCVLWMECRKELIEKVERIQNYAMRLILSEPPRSHSQDLRQILNWMPLTKRREEFRLRLVHRCVNQQAPAYMNRLFQLNRDVGYNTRTRGYDKLHLNSIRTDYGRKSFTFRGSQEWNSLSPDLRKLQSPTTFRNMLRTTLMQQ